MRNPRNGRYSLVSTRLTPAVLCAYDSDSDSAGYLARKTHRPTMSARGSKYIHLHLSTPSCMPNVTNHEARGVVLGGIAAVESKPAAREHIPKRNSAKAAIETGARASCQWRWADGALIAGGAARGDVPTMSRGPLWGIHVVGLMLSWGPG